jgi:HlyD family secretion protein
LEKYEGEAQMSAFFNLFKNKNTRNWGITLVVLLAGLLAWRIFVSADVASATADAENVATVVSVDVAETIEASGSLEAQLFASLDWKTGGVVETVYVQPGDSVKAGDILATLQPASTSSSIVSAKADLVNAQENLDDLLNSNTDFTQVVIDLKEAQEDYDAALDYLHYLKNEDRIPQTSTEVYLKSTRTGYKYQYKIKNFKGPATEDMLTEAENDLGLKESRLNDLQREYDRLKDGPNAQDVLAAQARVDAAQATVNMLSILAPFDGVVLSVDSRAGDVIKTGELSVNVANLDHLYVETQVDESDVAKVKVGSQAEVTLDAMPGLTLTGEVAVVDPVGEAVGGLVKYNVRIDLALVKDVFLPLGATANVVIQIDGSQSTLAVPIVAIQNDAQGEYVWAVRDGASVRVNVVGGAILDDMVAVTGDLQAGETLQIVHESSFSAPNPFGGGQE